MLGGVRGPTRDARVLAPLVAQPADDHRRRIRSHEFPPSRASYSYAGSSERQQWLAELPSYSRHRGSPTSFAAVGLPRPHGDELHDPDIITQAPGPMGSFFCTGFRDPRPALDPGPPPFTNLKPNAVQPQLPLRWPGDTRVVAFPSPLWWKPHDAYVAGRYMHRTQARCIIWAPEDDNNLLLGTTDECTLTPEAIEAIIASAEDCAALSAGAIALMSGDELDHRLTAPSLLFLCPPSIPRPGADPAWRAVMTSREHRDKLDDFRNACLNHLGLASLLLRGIPLEELMIAKPRDWLYPSFPGATYYDALEAYDVVEGRLAGIIIDLGRNREHLLPPLTLFACWSMPYTWYMHHDLKSPIGLRRHDHDWHRRHYFVLEQTQDEWQHAQDLYSQRQTEQQAPRVDQRPFRFEAFYVMPWKDNAGPRFERLLRYDTGEGGRSLAGLPVKKVDRSVVIRENYFDRFEYVENWPKGSVVFKGYNDSDWVEQEKEEFQARKRGRKLPRLPAPSSPEDEDSPSDEDLPVMRPASGPPASSPPPAPRPREGKQRAGCPFPRVIEPHMPLEANWRAIVSSAFPPPTPAVAPSSRLEHVQAPAATEEGPEASSSLGVAENSFELQQPTAHETGNSSRSRHGGWHEVQSSLGRETRQQQPGRRPLALATRRSPYESPKSATRGWRDGRRKPAQGGSSYRPSVPEASSRFLSWGAHCDGRL
ncbi:unnamed protein product [Peniophora sp. CBMAI 1063]|nr:unnamed protein product [Peniophora sp. CBMAI 1063]